jgi:hypothetical protein
MGRGRSHDAPDPEVARHDWIDEEATGGGASGGGTGSA